MDSYELKVAADSAIDSIDRYEVEYGSRDCFDSIRNQMVFISEKALHGESPVQALKGGKFTYSVIASKELSSPDENKIKEKLDRVSDLLDRMEGQGLLG